ncbi:MAG TPA: NAD-dependent protein deacetylase [Candidatus Nesterenkonia stercoripullorum]|uniref:protein acetyllysine N-acetyltransferase n=1 Tax=Candidatus Nesterenkonia stercoripullorum TaxID=2838701 RepID=A0A9D2A8Y4_9MICC|nr:NAD-dependent protein deacetylase [Candidatus Nesterenkonia stercoripullorum]
MEQIGSAAFTRPVANAHHAALRSIARVVDETAEPQHPDTARAGILAMLRDQNVLCVTGAGISTDSGIPDYRGPQGSLRRHRPMTFQEFQHDPDSRHRYWARSFVGWRHMAQAEPNHAHRVLASWQRAGLLSGLVTQNVDGLHAAAGSDPLVTLHGDLGVVVCLVCGNREDRRGLDVRLEEANPGYADSAMAAAENVNPDGDVTLDESWVQRFHMVACLVCGSHKLKPDVVYFGESVPAERKAAVDALIARSSSLLVIGSSMAVMSGFKIALTMHRQGKPIAVINGGPSRADSKAEFRWRTRIQPAIDDVEAGLERL